MASVNLGERGAVAAPRARAGQRRPGATSTLQAQHWTTDALVRTPAGPGPLLAGSLLPAEPQAPIAVTAPLEEEDRLLAEQFAQLRADLVFTLGELRGGARQAARTAWQEAVAAPAAVALAFVAGMWRRAAGGALRLGRGAIRMLLRSARFAAAVALDFLLLIMELADGDERDREAPAAAVPDDIPESPGFADLERVEVRLLDYRDLPFLPGRGEDANEDYLQRQALADVRRMARFAAGLPVPTAGPFAGMQVADAMLTATRDDLHAYFRHLLSERERYRGKGIRLAEGYALWAINGAPRPEIPVRKQRQPRS